MLISQLSSGDRGRFDEHPPSGLILERISDHREHREEVSPVYLIHLRV